MSDIHIKDYGAPGDGPKPGEQIWDSKELQEDFEVQGFAAPYVIVVRKSDRERGTLKFTHSPRLYYSFTPDGL